LQKFLRNIAKDKMNDKFKKILSCGLIGLFALLFLNLQGQTTIVKGKILDAKTGENLSYVNITTNTRSSSFVGTISDEKGMFTLSSPQSFDTIIFQFIGYKTVKIKIKPHQSQNITVEMKNDVVTLKEANVVAKKERYRRKNNPAVELMNKVEDNKDKNNITNNDYYQFKKHEKIEMSLLDVNDSLSKKKTFKHLSFLFDNIQVSELNGKKYLPVYFMEKLYENHYRKSPECNKTMLMAQKDIQISKFMEPTTVDFMLKDVFGEINVYNNSIRILSNDVVSPLAPFATRFYQFFITDTVKYKEDSCIVLSFNPANMQDIGFNGKLWISKDSNYAVRKIIMSFPKKTNINFVTDFAVYQQYDYIDNKLCLTEDKVLVDCSIYGAKWHGKKVSSYAGYLFNKPLAEDFYNNNDITERVPEYNKRNNTYWEQNRIEPLTESEKKTYNITNSLNSFTAYKILTNTLMAFVSGYVEWGKIDYGPLENTVSWNNIEGVRLRVGGKTNMKFNKHIFLNGFAAYGTKDETWKYQGEVMYSFADKLYHQWEFPMNLLTVGYEKNTDIPGQKLEMGTYDRFFLSFNRGDIDMMTLNRKIYMQYDYETMSQMGFKIRLEHLQEKPLAQLTFTSFDGKHTFDPLTAATINLEFRYAKNEQFFQTQKYRLTMNSTSPIFTVDYTYCPKILSSDYEFQKVKVALYKRWFILSFGFADLNLEAGKVFGKTAYPLLFVHQANQNWAYQDEAFNLMNYFEFVSDYYGQAILNYNFNGYIFNRIPLIKKLKLREVFAVKAIWGGLTDENTPSASHPELMEFAKTSDGQYRTYHLEKKPYVEANIGVDNVFKVLRIDYVRRFTYLDNPNVAKWGIRFRFRFTF
jgi:hypothetical protein